MLPASVKGSAMSLQSLLHDERAIIGALLDDAFSRGYLVSVYDGEEWALTASDSRPAVEANVGATDATTLRFRDPARVDQHGKSASVGSVFLVHGNGSDVIADYSDNADTAALLAPALALADRLAVVS